MSKRKAVKRVRATLGQVRDAKAWADAWRESHVAAVAECRRLRRGLWLAAGLGLAVGYGVSTLVWRLL